MGSHGIFVSSSGSMLEAVVLGALVQDGPGIFDVIKAKNSEDYQRITFSLWK